MGALNPTSDRPLYRQIADRLRTAIREGRYGPEAPLPSENALAETYRVTRTTARQAIDVLKLEGLVYGVHGKGVFVRQQPIVHRLARNRFGRAYRETGRGAYDVEMKELGLTPRTELTELGPTDPPLDVAKRLQLDQDERTLIRRRHMFASDNPMQIATSWIPWSLAEGTQMTERDSGRGGIYSRLAEKGHGPARFTEDVATRMPSPEESDFLRLDGPQPILYVVRTAYDSNDRPVEVCEHILAGDRWQLSYEWPAED